MLRRLQLIVKLTLHAQQWMLRILDTANACMPRGLLNLKHAELEVVLPYSHVAALAAQDDR